MRFQILYNDEIIGFSQLEHCDCGIGEWVLFGIEKYFHDSKE